MKEIYLGWFFTDQEQKDFCVISEILDPERHDSTVLVVDYDYTPWPRVDGNLLWP